jgi:hypothetical protein
VLALEHLRGHVFLGAADRLRSVVLFEIALAHAEIAYLEVSVDIHEDVFRLNGGAVTLRSRYSTFFRWMYYMASSI